MRCPRKYTGCSSTQWLDLNSVLNIALGQTLQDCSLAMTFKPSRSILLVFLFLFTVREPSGVGVQAMWQMPSDDNMSKCRSSPPPGNQMWDCVSWTKRKMSFSVVCAVWESMNLGCGIHAGINSLFYQFLLTPDIVYIGYMVPYQRILRVMLLTHQSPTYMVVYLIMWWSGWKFSVIISTVNF